MKLHSVSIAGIRGFNSLRAIAFDSGLTVISAPNSCGKTSISESLEWLLYGTTSKCANAHYKEEYRGSLRNAHYPDDAVPFVEAVIEVDGSKLTIRSVLSDGDAACRTVDGAEVSVWPFSRGIEGRPAPLVLQHALKYLLLVTPSDRFEGFTKLLGLHDLFELQKAVVSLCTKPEAKIPHQVEEVLARSTLLVDRVAGQSGLATIANHLKRGTRGLAVASRLAKELADDRSGTAPGSDPLPGLLAKRDEAVAKFFSGSVAVQPLAGDALSTRDHCLQFASSFCGNARCEAYGRLSGMHTALRIAKLATFFTTGMDQLQTAPDSCPFCGQHLDDDAVAHIREHNKEAVAANQSTQNLVHQCDEQRRDLDELRRKSQTIMVNTLGQAGELCRLASLDQVGNVLGNDHTDHFRQTAKAYTTVRGLANSVQCCQRDVAKAIESISLALEAGTAGPGDLEELARLLAAFVGSVKAFDEAIAQFHEPLQDAERLLRFELDRLAGTEELSVLVDLLRDFGTITKACKVRDVLDGLKDLRKGMDQFVSGKLLDAIDSSLSAGVMQWYSQIRTNGDPDVHFSGFDLPRTARGEFKKTIAIKAKSYGKELVSAVSCLSESKLNALGLCVSIAANTNADCPFGFILIDDPIQSLDDDHEAQFVQIIHSLVESGKQVILLSHNAAWLNQVRDGCRSLNGRFYKITGYTVDGPVISEEEWCPIKHRIDEAQAILKNQGADDLQLQRAEGELRLAITQIAAKLYKKIKGKDKNPADLNSQRCRALLNECGIDSSLIDQVCQAFPTADDSHHAPPHYAPNRKRIDSLMGSVTRLFGLLNTSR